MLCTQSERWNQCDVSTEKQRAVDKLTSGKAFLADSDANGETESKTDGTVEAKTAERREDLRADAEGKRAQPGDVVVDGKRFKVGICISNDYKYASQ
jgi:hypothetical protein